jgi:hypothetical protein
MKSEESVLMKPVDRRSFLKKSAVTAGAVAVGAGVLSHGLPAFGQESNASLNKGDIAILQFLAAAEILESDLWQQYAELGGVNADPNQPLNNYQTALSNLDGDGPQYISSNTLDEFSHANFLNAYLESKGANPVNLDKFRVLQGSKASGAANTGRLTNLLQLNVDTSWYVRYRSTTNPDFGATFPQAITLNGVPAIPRTNADFDGPPFQNATGIPGNVHIQAIANVAAFHFGYIEQGGSSLYAALSQKVSSLEVLKITLGIGGDEVAHFLEWVDFAGNGVQPPVAPFTDPLTKLKFPNFFNPANPLIQPNLIFPVPAQFISPNLPLCATIRPTDDRFAGAVATIKSFTADNLFVGQSQEFFQVLSRLATAADAASRQL